MMIAATFILILSALMLWLEYDFRKLKKETDLIFDELDARIDELADRLYLIDLRKEGRE